MALRPEYTEAQWNSSVAQLTLGQLPAGSSGFELRGKQRHADLPRWSPTASGEQVLIHAEQGLGDTIQFVRYCAQVQQSGARVTLECHPELIPLFRTAAGVNALIGFGADLPAVDLQAPLMSLPLILNSNLSTLPGAVPYLTADPTLVVKWRARLDVPRGNLAIGLVWAGNPNHKNDRNRSIGPELFRTLGQPANVSFYCLQQKPQSAGVSAMSPLVFRDIFDEITFSDTAAIVSNLDLVISVDTATAHLAGALARPVWTLLPFAPDWRWMLDRTDSPWYPTMRLFRQPRLNDWQSVLENVRSELQQLAITPRKTGPITRNFDTCGPIRI